MDIDIIVKDPYKTFPYSYRMGQIYYRDNMDGYCAEYCNRSILKSELLGDSSNIESYLNIPRYTQDFNNVIDAIEFVIESMRQNFQEKG